MRARTSRTVLAAALVLALLTPQASAQPASGAVHGQPGGGAWRAAGFAPGPEAEPPDASAQAVNTDRNAVLDLTFPVAGSATFIDDYDHDRGGGSRKHQATDVFADKLQHVHAAVGGIICWITGIDEPEPPSGYLIELCGDDGRRYSYIHLNNDTPGTDDGRGGPEWAYAPGIRRGVEVERGQWIGYVGDSGNAEETPPHLHFQIVDPDLVDPTLASPPWKQGWRNPYLSLVAARERGDVPGGTPAPPAPTPSATPTPAPPPEDAPPAIEVRRTGGKTRIDTAVKLSRARRTARTVVVVPQGSHVEALVAAPLAGLVGAPLLLSAADGLSPAVKKEIRRLAPHNAYLVGDASRLSERVEADLTAAGVKAQARLAANDPYALSALVADELASYPAVDTARVLIARGDDADPTRAWPDALAASSLGAAALQPVLLTDGRELTPAVTRSLGLLDPSEVVAIGGRKAISKKLLAAAARAADVEKPGRIAGRTRYETAIAVADEAVAHGLDGDGVLLATGWDFPDALAAGPAAAVAGMPLVLIDGRDLKGSPPTVAWLDRRRDGLRSVTLIGGKGVISADVANRLERRLNR